MPFIPAVPSDTVRRAPFCACISPPEALVRFLPSRLSVNCPLTVRVPDTDTPVSKCTVISCAPPAA